MHEQSDWRLLQRLLDPNTSEAAFEAFYLRYSNDLFSFAMSYKCRSLAEDALQHTFKVLFEQVVVRKKTLISSDSQKLEPWLFTVARNYLIDQHRKKVKERECCLALEERQRCKGLKETPEVLEVQSAIQGLEEPLRAIIYLRFNQGISFSQIAKTLQVSPRTIYRQFEKAKETLVRKLGGER